MTAALIVIVVVVIVVLAYLLSRATGPRGAEDLLEQLNDHLTGPPADVRAECRKVLEVLVRRCPNVVPPGPLPSGQTAEPLPMKSAEVTRLVRAAMAPEPDADSVIWEHAGSELLVHTGRTRIEVLDGVVLVGVTVESDQLGETEVVVPFAVGTAEQLAGMIATTERRPRGPDPLVDHWGDALIAAAWDALLAVAEELSSQIGVDETGSPLRPGALVAAAGTLSVVPQARHRYEERLRR